MCNVIQVADAADVIVNGYAFTKTGNHIRILNLNKPDKAAFISKVGEVLETTMDDIENRRGRITVYHCYTFPNLTGNPRCRHRFL